MATKTFGQDLNVKFKTYDEFVGELYKLAGVNFPLQIKVEDGELLGITYDTEFKVGGTTPIEEEVEIEKTIVVDGVEEKIKVTETRVVDYKEDYETIKLTKVQQEAIDKYIQDNLKNE